MQKEKNQMSIVFKLLEKEQQNEQKDITKLDYVKTNYECSVKEKNLIDNAIKHCIIV